MRAELYRKMEGGGDSKRALLISSVGVGSRERVSVINKCGALARVLSLQRRGADFINFCNFVSADESEKESAGNYVFVLVSMTGM